MGEETFFQKVPSTKKIFPKLQSMTCSFVYDKGGDIMAFPMAFAASAEAEIFRDKGFKEASVWELIKDLVRPEIRPFDCLQVEVTSHCAARCTYCPHTLHADSWQGAHMHCGTFANLWPLLRQSTRIHLQGWGEPFLHPHFFPMVAFARKAGCLVSSTTCAASVQEKTAVQIMKSGMDILAFSLAGTDAKSNAVRQGADFDKVCNSIQTIQAIRKERMAVHLDLHIAYILLADRLPAVLNLPELMQHLGVRTAVISTLDYVPSPHLAALAITPHDTEKLAEAKEYLRQASVKAKEYGVHLHYTLPTAIAGGVCRENIQKSLYVNTQGSISPCVYLNIPSKQALYTEIFGNVNEVSALDIWQREDFVRFRQEHAKGCPTSPLCLHCVKRHEQG